MLKFPCGNKTVSRRQALKSIIALLALVCSPAGCTRHRYVRKAEELDLGAVKELLYDRVHVRNRAVLLFRDNEGWKALSARCSYEGCDLTFNEPLASPPILLCSCCKTRFDLDGRVMGGGPAEQPLPWIDVYYRDGHLYANPGTLRAASWRFMTPEIREAEEVLRQQVKTEGLTDEAKIPQTLSGNPDKDPGMMFIEDDPTLMDQLRMAK